MILRLYQPDPRVVGSDTGSAAVEHLHKFTLKESQMCQILAALIVFDHVVNLSFSIGYQDRILS